MSVAIGRAGFPRLTRALLLSTAITLVSAFVTSSALATICIVPNVGGTAELPPNCPDGYLSPDEVHEIIDGLPPGATIEVGIEHSDFALTSTTPGGTLGGEIELFDSYLVLTLTGTGLLTGFNRVIGVPVPSTETHTGPRNPGDPIQTFANEMYSLQGGISGDPDFDTLEITAGLSFGLPSPGQTTLTRQGGVGGDFAVDSFFDITYQIDFVGQVGSQLEGMSGSTLGTVRMRAGEPSVPPGPKCIIEDDGTGTAALPPEGPGCPNGYISPEDVHLMIAGLPPGATIELDPIHDRFMNIGATPGGYFGGEVETFDSSLTLAVTGTGDLAGFNRNLTIPMVGAETHTGPRNPGDPVQSFPNEMVRLQGGIAGDPDFDTLEVRAGRAFGLPGSFGETTLTQLPDGRWDVDSFFDITYQIDFVGAPGSQLEGMSGTTQGTIRMQAGVPGPDTSLPTLSDWGLAFVVMLLIGIGFFVGRRRMLHS